jgi:O-6-methylguanine DNA methyltransferase
MTPDIAVHRETVPALGSVSFAATTRGLCLISLAEPGAVRRYLQRRYPGAPLVSREEAFLEIVRQMREYLGGARTRFEVPLDPLGTEFQQSIWKAIAAIPYGETTTYGRLAAGIGRPAAARAVGAATGANPLCIVIPCHRVIGTSGKLTGYAYGLATKEKLLGLERSLVARRPIA